MEWYITLSQLLVSYKYLDMIWHFDFNNGNIQHYSNTDGWKEIEDYFKCLNLLPNKKLLLPIIFCDEYEEHRQKKNNYTGIYLILANSNKVTLIKILN